MLSLSLFGSHELIWWLLDQVWILFVEERVGSYQFSWRDKSFLIWFSVNHIFSSLISIKNSKKNQIEKKLLFY